MDPNPFNLVEWCRRSAPFSIRRKCRRLIHNPYKRYSLLEDSTEAAGDYVIDSFRGLTAAIRPFMLQRAI